jgi:hypothetical protein
LEETGQDDGEEETLVSSDLLNGCKTDDSESGSRSADAHLGAGEQADDNTAHDAGDDAAE